MAQQSTHQPPFVRRRPAPALWGIATVIVATIIILAVITGFVAVMVTIF